MPTPISVQQRLYDQNTERLARIIRPVKVARYSCDLDWNSLEHSLRRYDDDWGLDLTPDFQRGHVWTDAQRVHYIENVIRGVVPVTGLQIQMNCPNWEDDSYTGDLPPGMQCIDGLQRITAVRMFIAGQVKPFGLSVDDLRCSKFHIGHMYSFRMSVFDYGFKHQLLQHYIDFNAGGVPHSNEEIERVREMLRVEVDSVGSDPCVDSEVIVPTGC